MKKINIFLLTLISAFALSSCSDTEDPVLGEAVTPVLESLSPQDIVIDEETDLSKVISTWKWTPADYGVPTQITYAVEFDVAGGNFEKPQTLISITDSELAITAGMLNKAASSFISGTSVITLEVRLKTTVSRQVAPVYSNVQQITFTAFIAEKTPLYIVGDALIGWTNDKNSIGNNLQVFFSDNSITDDIYTYTGYFQAKGGLKLITQAGNWDTAYAYADDGGLSPNNGTNNNLPAPTKSGLYTLTANLKTLSYTLEPYVKENIRTYEKVMMIGDAHKGWEDKDVLEMTKYAEHVWVATNVELKTGGIKFRTVKPDGSADWSDNWGYSPSQVLPFGISDGGDNFPIEKEGMYFVAFNDLTKHYVIIEMEKLPGY